MTQKFSAVILAAGYSVRMGVPKWSLMFDASRTFAEKIVDEFAKAGAEKIVIVLNESGKEQFEKQRYKMPDNFQIALNDNQDLGRFYSLKTGLQECDIDLPVCFTNIDNPFITADIITKLFKERDKADYISPSYEGKGGHPVLISSKVVKSINSSKLTDRNLKEFLIQYKREKVAVDDPNVLVNINTKSEYIELLNQ